jgi:starvation-inducible DNA-binding protein
MPRQNASRMTKIAEHTRFDTRIDLAPDTRQQLVELLNARLADTIDLYSQAKFAHWNVKGKDFYQVHLLFDTIAEHIEQGVDLIAERITGLGGTALGTVRQVAESSSIGEYDVRALTSMDHVQELAEQVSKVANAARRAIDETDDLGDRATADLFTEIVRQLDQDLYFLEAHLQA